MKDYTTKKYEKLWNKIIDLIRSITNNLDNYDKKCMKIKFITNDYLPLKKTLELHKILILVRSVFHEDNKCLLQVF